MINHKIKFDNINDLLNWIIENQLYSLAPVSLVLHLGEQNAN